MENCRTADGQTLVLSAQDGYCSVVAFEPGELGTPYKLTVAGLPPPPTPSLPAPAVSQPSIATAFINKPPTGPVIAPTSTTETKRAGEDADAGTEPLPKKAKKKAALTFLGPLGS